MTESNVRTLQSVIKEKIEDLKEAEAAIKARLMYAFPHGTRWRFEYAGYKDDPIVEGTVIDWPGGINAVVRFRHDHGGFFHVPMDHIKEQVL